MYQANFGGNQLTTSSLSDEFGLPSSIPQEVLSMEELDRAALPADFASAMRITFDSTKISKLIDLQMSSNLSTDANTTHFGLLRMLELDLNALADSMRIKEPKSGSMTEFSLLMAKLNLCSFGLNQATKLKTSDALQLRLSAFNYATSLIQLFVAAPFISAQAGGSVATPSLPVQTFYPRSYWKGLVHACLVLLKLTLMRTLPELEACQSEVAIQQAVDLLTACSVEGDELYRVTRLICFLRQEAVQEVIEPRHKVHSRMGASLMYEMIFSVLAWKKQKAREQHEDSRNRPKDSNLIENASRMDTNFSMPDWSPRAIDELIASSGYLIEGLGPMELDTNFWDTSMFDQVCLAIDAILLCTF